MSKSKIKGKDLKKINYKSDRAKSLAINIINSDFKHLSKQDKLALLEDVLINPKDYIKHVSLVKLAEELIGKIKTNHGTIYHLDNIEKPFAIYGNKHITHDTVRQMATAIQLPISEYGALMPDAHVGYGLPIGGVLAARNAVLPYGVGLDIGCRMSLSIYDVPSEFIKRNSYQIKTALKEQTHFGIGKIEKHNLDHEILERNEFNEIEILRQLKGKAQNQLGSSGSGNHFVEFGTVELGPENAFDLKEGKYVGILAHSGSRGLGASIADYYTKVAKRVCLLPNGAQHLAWLDLDSEAGQEYWLAMNLAGDYAKACHDTIHYRLSKTLGLKPVLHIENHHNFAWKEQIDGQELIVHRKGATPAAKGQFGIIPANMIDPGYIVSGKGDGASLNSASHGAGRRLSRKKAKDSYTGSELKKLLNQNKITLIGGGTEEAPMAYKNLEEVMGAQKDVINIEGKFYPQIVRMDKQ
ncbi:RtcB family protein [Plebeiibacterium sediminum]|uniref:3'-phosphate/5'-hydroxy nucleic acid ligase n=1 Tax=Plebeiibacterium sediminum TaxID=2992112 RepID=A0AAE3M6L4_9BACT|nr:RtcB family protein [Plebeiobacterium sediminum]MCW3788174.1 RtcB family protein [Plebeiobacterium sediminum]